MKNHVNLSIDEELVKLGKKLNLNFSAELERTIINKKNAEILKGDAGLKCFYCGLELPKQTVQDLEHGLVWLIPDEQWCCPECLRQKRFKIIIGVTENV